MIELLLLVALGTTPTQASRTVIPNLKINVVPTPTPYYSCGPVPIGNPVPSQPSSTVQALVCCTWNEWGWVGNGLGWRKIPQGCQ